MRLLSAFPVTECIQGNSYKKLLLFLPEKGSACTAVAIDDTCFTLISQKDCSNNIKVVGESCSKPLR